jgi:hypothetical protein
MNGGAFGFEGSILSVIFLLTAFCALWIYYSRKENLVPATVPVKEATGSVLEADVLE